MNEGDEQCKDSLDDYPADPDKWIPPDGWVETHSGEKLVEDIANGRDRMVRLDVGIRKAVKEGKNEGLIGTIRVNLEHIFIQHAKMIDTMFLKLDNYNTGWIGLKISLKTDDIDILIKNLEFLKNNPFQHFHISSDFEGEAGVGDIEIYVDDESPENMRLLGQALEPNR